MSREPSAHDDARRIDHVDVDGVGEGFEIRGDGNCAKADHLSLHVDGLVGSDEDGHGAEGHRQRLVSPCLRSLSTCSNGICFYSFFLA